MIQQYEPDYKPEIPPIGIGQSPLPGDTSLYARPKKSDEPEFEVDESSTTRTEEDKAEAEAEAEAESESKSEEEEKEEGQRIAGIPPAPVLPTNKGIVYPQFPEPRSNGSSSCDFKKRIKRASIMLGQSQAATASITILPQDMVVKRGMRDGEFSLQLPYSNLLLLQKGGTVW